MKRLLILGLVALVTLLVAAACGGDDEDATVPTQVPAATGGPAATTGPAATSPPAGGEQREVHFYQVNALTGQSASYGTRSIRGAEIASRHINEDGGFNDSCGNNYTVKLTVHDMANSREQAIAGIRKAADDSTVLASLGSTPSTGFVPMVPVAKQVKLPIIGTGTAAPIEEWNEYAFRVTITTQSAAPGFVNTLHDGYNFNRVAFIFDITQDAQRGEAEFIRDLADEVGYEIVSFEAFRAGDKDFRSQITKVMTTNPDWVGVYGATPEGTAIINQMSEMGVLGDVEIFTGSGSFNGPSWWDLTEGKVKGGVTWAANFDLEGDDPLVRRAIETYDANWDDGTTLFMVYGYQAVQAGVEAVKITCSATDREAFRDALATIDFDAIAGPVKFNNPRSAPNGENQAGSFIINRVSGPEGAFVLLGQEGEEPVMAKGEQREAHFFEVNALTGQSASYGIRSIHGIELATKHINDAGGFQDNCGNTYTVKFTLHDMANSREQAIAGLRKAADDPTVIVSLGSTPSTGFVPMVPVAGQVKLPIIGTGTAAPIAEWNPYAFRVTVTTQAAVPPFMATMVARFPSFKKISIIYDITQDAQRAEAEMIRDLADTYGYEIVGFEAFRAGDKDFRSQLTKMRGNDPDWIGIYGATPEGTAIINQISEMGIRDDVELFVGFGSSNQPDWWTLTDGRVAGTVSWVVGFDLAQPGFMQTVLNDYQEMFPEGPDVQVVYGYQAFQAAVDAIKRSCTATDREAFRDALATTNIDALGGKVIFDSPRDNPLGENRSGVIVVARAIGEDATAIELIPLAE